MSGSSFANQVPRPQSLPPSVMSSGGPEREVRPGDRSEQGGERPVERRIPRKPELIPIREQPESPDISLGLVKPHPSTVASPQAELDAHLGRDVPVSHEEVRTGMDAAYVKRKTSDSAWWRFETLRRFFRQLLRRNQ